jgi:hypothetical protein
MLTNVASASIGSFADLDDTVSDKLLKKDDALANHLSRNSTLHVFKETSEEVLITILKRIYEVYNVSPETVRIELTSRELADVRETVDKNARLQKVLHNDSLSIMLATCLLRLGSHFRHRPEFSVTWLAKSMGVCLGVSRF